MGVSLEKLIADVRRDSGLRNNRLFSDEQIASILTDAYADLRDKMIARFAYWFRSSYDFSLASGEEGNFITLSSAVPDLEMVQQVFLMVGGIPYPVPLMSSLAELNQINSTWMFSAGYSFNGFMGRKYFIDGDFLFVYPSANALGDYRLVYTPQPQRFAFPVTVDFDMSNTDVPSVPPTGGLDGTGSWAFANANPDNATDIPAGGFDLALTFTTTNLTFSGTYNVVDVGLPPQFGSPTFGVSNLASTSGFTFPPTGSGTYTYQPAGSISELPEALTPWAKYLTLYASIVIRTSRRQSMRDLELQFQQIEKRIIAITKQRTEGVRQAPITRTNYGGGFNFNGGF